MRCLKPIYVKWIDKESGVVKGSEVPCGKCPNCMVNYQQQWIYRLYYEQKCSALCLFVTLTYDDEHLRYYNGVPTVFKRDVQLFNKRLREELHCIQLDNPNGDSVIDEQNKSFRSGFYRYYIASEYGSNTFRPHYHAIMFFSWCVMENRHQIETAISKCWEHGFVSFGDVTTNSIAYVTKYVLKEQPQTNGLPPFTLTSRRPGLGFQYTVDYKLWHGDNPEKMYVVMEGGVKYPLPRYFKDKLGFTKETLLKFSEQRKIENYKEECNQVDFYKKYFDKSYHSKKFEDYQFKKFQYERKKYVRSKNQKL